MGAQQDQDAKSSCAVRFVGEPVLVPPSKPSKRESSYFLSNLDQNLAVVMHTVYFYKGSSQTDDDHGQDPAEVVRKALEDVLADYYPLSGRLKLSPEMKLEVDCNDQGALFVEAAANLTMEEFLKEFTRSVESSEEGSVSTAAASLMKFVYTVPGARNILEIPPLVAQVTKFSCGGFALGICTNHAIFDGIAAMEFMNSWGEVARGIPLSVPPILDRSMLKARNPPRIDFPHPEFLDINENQAADESPITQNLTLDFRSLKFDSDWLDSLKKSIIQEGVLEKCSSFEAFSALVWKCRTMALAGSSNCNRTKLLFAVDVRNRLDPVLPKGYSGNGILLTCALTGVDELVQGSLSQAIELIRGAICRVDDSYLRSLIDFYEETRLRPSLESTLVITTWSRLEFHTTDFGWGVPVLTAPASLPEPEVALFLPQGTSRRGIELVMGLPRDAMKRFVCLMETIWKN